MIRGMNLCGIAGCTHEAEEAGMCSMHFTSALVHGAFATLAAVVRRIADPCATPFSKAEPLLDD